MERMRREDDVKALIKSRCGNLEGKNKY